MWDQAQADLTALHLRPVGGSASLVLHLVYGAILGGVYVPT